MDMTHNGRDWAPNQNAQVQSLRRPPKRSRPASISSASAASSLSTTRPTRIACSARHCPPYQTTRPGRTPGSSAGARTLRSGGKPPGPSRGARRLRSSSSPRGNARRMTAIRRAMDRAPGDCASRASTTTSAATPSPARTTLRAVWLPSGVPASGVPSERCGWLPSGVAVCLPSGVATELCA
jgi:hypothetical protein